MPQSIEQIGDAGVKRPIRCSARAGPKKKPVAMDHSDHGERHAAAILAR